METFRIETLRNPLPLWASACLVAAWLTTLPADARTPSRGAGQAPGPAASMEAAPVPDASSAPAPDSADTPGIDTARNATAPADSASSKDSIQVRRYDYIAYPALQVITWPVEKVLVPLVQGVIFPSKEPLRYIINENVIDRTIDLISFGEQDRIMVYPTMNLAPGTGSSTGLTLRHNGLFGRPSERLVAMGSLFVNGDWRFRSYINVSHMLGTNWDAKLTVTMVRVKNTRLNQPGTSVYWYYADTSNGYSAALSHLLWGRLGARVTGGLRHNHFGRAPLQDERDLVSPFFLNDSGRVDTEMRGLNKDWWDRTLVLALSQDSRNNENITLAGSDFRLQWHYHFTTAKHDYHAWEGVWTRYFKLGKEKYEISVEEERKAGDMSIRKVLKKLEVEKLRHQIFNRKVVAARMYLAQSFEVPGNHMPVYGLQTLGNDTPMRGYAGSRFRNYTIASLGAEYRFPVMRLVDGVIFNEYGVAGRSWDSIDYLGDLKNSWGFGIRVRRPDIFLFRAQLGFHGAQGIMLNLSVDAPY